MAATIKDIRRETGLSLATISKYLNGGNVRPENRALIENAIKKLHYEVNEIARGLVTNRTHTIGVVVYSIESLFTATLLHHIHIYLRNTGYAAIICDSVESEEIEAENIRFLISKKVDGIIVIPQSRSSACLNPAREKGIPVVVVDRPFLDAECDCVSINNRMAAFRAAKMLIEYGHRRIAVICSDKEYTGIERYLGFLDAVHQAGLEIPEQYQKKGLHAIEFGYRSMEELLRMKERPTAVFMTNYEITLGAVMAINEADVRCPEDISMFGFDNLLLSHIVKPQLYLVVQPMQEIAKEATQLILERIETAGGEEQGPAREIVLGTTIQNGNSIRRMTK